MPTSSSYFRSLPDWLAKIVSDLDSALERLEETRQRRPPSARSQTPKSRLRTLASERKGMPKNCPPICVAKIMIPPAKLRVMATKQMEELAAEESALRGIWVGGGGDCDEIQSG